MVLPKSPLTRFANYSNTSYRFLSKSNHLRQIVNHVNTALITVWERIWEIALYWMNLRDFISFKP